MSARDPSQLDAALGLEIERLELMICQLWRVLALLSVILGLVTYLVLGLRMGAWCSLGAAVCLLWFSLEERIRAQRAAPRWLVVASVLVESLMPWAFLLILAVTQSATYALGSWVPPMLFCALIVASTARLWPARPLILAGSGALAFATLYFAVVRGLLPSHAADDPLFTPAMQIARSLSLVAGGILGSVAAGGLQKALARAHATVRERDLFGKYRLERRLGAGGMATVHQATYCPEGGFERPVAVKQIHDHLAREPRFVDAFRHEAELSARLVHPNIVQVLDFGRIGERYFLALEYVDGITLAQLLKQLRDDDELLALPLAAYVTAEMLAGLAYSHAGARDAHGQLMRVVHRDLCPANVLLSANGEVKIADFGVARALRDTASASTTSVVGHVAYISPEQAQAKPVDERSDLFSLGAIVWEMLCNRPLFHRGAEAPTLMALVHADIPRPSSERGLLDTGWDEVVLRALERDVEQRAPSAQALLRLLEHVDDAHPSDDVAKDLATLVRQVVRRQSPPPTPDEGLTVALGRETVAHDEAATRLR